MNKIHFFSGSFDPPHLGHREIAKITREFCDRLIIFPTHQSPAKLHPPFSPDADRFEMSTLNFSGIPGLLINDYELNSAENNFTIKTVYYLKEKFPGDELTLVIGKDQWIDFKNWYRWQEILKTINILCFNRDETTDNIKAPHQRPNVRFYTKFHFQVSSHKIRSMLRSKEDRVKKYLKREVYSYIQTRGLYQ